MIEAEHTMSGRRGLSPQTSMDPTIEQAINDIIDKHMPVISDIELGPEMDWTKEVDRMEQEITASERKYSDFIPPQNILDDKFYNILEIDEGRPLSVMDNDPRKVSSESMSSGSIVHIPMRPSEEARQMEALSSRQAYQE